jgi:hypothetical protein
MGLFHSTEAHQRTNKKLKTEEKPICYFSQAIDLSKVLDKKVLNLKPTLKDIANGPVDAFNGLGPTFDKYWRVLGVKSVKDLSELKCVRYAL